MFKSSYYFPISELFLDDSAKSISNINQYKMSSERHKALSACVQTWLIVHTGFQKRHIIYDNNVCLF